MAFQWFIASALVALSRAAFSGSAVEGGGTGSGGAGSASFGGSGSGAGDGYFGGGTSTISRQQNINGVYNFNYGINDGLGGGSGRWEAGDGLGGVVGYYTLKGPDGRNRRVEYVADKLGFRARVKSNEQGTANSFPASVAFESPYSGPVAPGSVEGTSGSYKSNVNHIYKALLSPALEFSATKQGSTGYTTDSASGSAGYPAGVQSGAGLAAPKGFSSGYKSGAFAGTSGYPGAGLTASYGVSSGSGRFSGTAEYPGGAQPGAGFAALNGNGYVPPPPGIGFVEGKAQKYPH